MSNIFADEFYQRYANRFFGKYRGIVHRTSDPKKKARLILKVPAVAGTEDVGWALPNPSSGGSTNTGDFWCPEVGDAVWVEFEEGDPERPVWKPGPWGTRDGASMLMEHSRGEADDIDFTVRDHGNIPPSQFAGTYTNVRVMRAKDGGLLEFDSTEGEERVQLSHRTGSRIEFLADGGMQEISTANTKKRIEGNSNVEIGGDEAVFVGGLRTAVFSGDVTEQYQGNLEQQIGEFFLQGVSLEEIWEGGVSTKVGGTWGVSADSQCSLTTAGQMAFMVGQNLQATVMENFELSASNATNTDPTAPAISMHGYNGNVEIKATDPTGLANEAILTLVGNTLPGTPMIKFGGDSAVEPFVKGNSLAAFLAKFLTQLALHTHPPTGGPPLDAAFYTALIAEIVSLLSLEVMGK